ncbi:MAG: InlB B-repeat-containing protein [Clostridia bacterium]|nr:InlB B-repeat-containing protein [Clostridia bacterium]
MKTLRKILIAVLSVCMLFSFSIVAACGGGDEPTNTATKYQVTFMVEGQQYGQVQKVVKGRRATEPATPTFSVEGYVFTGWYTSETFEEGTLWNFSTGTVKSDIILYAGYRVVSVYVSDVKMAEEPLTSKIVWTQAAMSQATDYVVTISDGVSAALPVNGTFAFDDKNFVVTFTPDQIPQGGEYTVSVVDNSKTQPACVAEGLLFGGEGSEANPYLIDSNLDFVMVNGANVAENTFFKLIKGITLETSRADQQGFEFNGVLDGNNRTITLANSNSAAIYKIGANGLVKDLVMAGKVSSSNNSLGTVADFNAGKIQNVYVTANVESTGGSTGSSSIQSVLVADPTQAVGVAGGVVGTNLSTGIITDCKISTLEDSSTGTIKARIAGGCIAGINYGKVELCVGDGCFGAWNANETGKSTSNYSYSGGIVGINAGIVEKCVVADSGKVLAQRYAEDSQAVAAAGTTNINIGGIVGYNVSNAVVSQCSFAGVRVHGDENVGGIVGLNEGTVTDCYAEGVLQSTDILVYVGGRTNVGGIVGKNVNGTVVNCFSTANVFAYGENAVAYALAENATNSVYITANPNTKSRDANNKEEGNPSPVAIIAPKGEGNVAITVAGGSFDGTTNNMVVAEEHLVVINGNNAYVFNGTTIKLAFAVDTAPESSVTVSLYDNLGELVDSVEVFESASVIEGFAPSGYKFVGWATQLNGEMVFKKDDVISLYDLVDYEDNDGNIKLYAVVEEDLVTLNTTVKISVWGNAGTWITDTELEQIKSGFLAYLAQQEIDTTTLTITYVESEKTKVADLGAEVNEAGDFDIIIGCGSNVTTKGGVEVIEKADIASIYVGAGRMTARITDNTLAVQLYEYLTQFDTQLKVSVWGNSGTWVTANELEDIKSGFLAHLADLGVDVNSLTITYVESEKSKVADLGAEVNEAGDFDIIIGCGSNVTTKGGVEVIEKADIASNYVGAGRMTARITNNDLAILLYDYLITVVGA